MELNYLIITALENSTITKNGYSFHIHTYNWKSLEFTTSSTNPEQNIVAQISLEEMLELLSKERDTDGIN
jgi:hypothetical protein